MTSRIALLALLPLLVLGGTARADDHSAREVEERFGDPQEREIVTCGGVQGGEAVRCLRWQYDTGANHAVFYFESGSERLLEVFTWEDGVRDVVDASDQVRTLLHAARNVSGP